jgi:hypothetical protein
MDANMNANIQSLKVSAEAKTTDESVTANKTEETLSADEKTMKYLETMKQSIEKHKKLLLKLAK